MVSMGTLITLLGIIVILLSIGKGKKSSIMVTILGIVVLLFIAHVILKYMMATMIGHIIYGMISIIRWATTIIEVVVAIIVVRWLINRRK